MKIVYNPTFTRHFIIIEDYITENSFNSANKFKSRLKVKIESIPNFPYKFRKSLYYEDENIRDYIFKGYTIPYLIDTEKDQILILDIFKWMDK